MDEPNQQDLFTIEGDKLDAIFSRQKTLSDLFQFVNRTMQEMTYTERVRTFTLALVVETIEILNTYAWKPWRVFTEVHDVKKPLPSQERLEEMADALHFLIQLCIMSGYTASDLYMEYMRKADVNEDRAEHEMRKAGG